MSPVSSQSPTTHRAPAVPPPVKRARHLMDPADPRPASYGSATPGMSLTQVQQWVMSVLAVVTILHMSAGLIVAAATLGDGDPAAEIGLSVITGAFGALAVAAALAIHERPILRPWLLLGLVPTAVGLWVSLQPA